MNTPAVIIGKVFQDKSVPAGISRVAATVDGELFWFESGDTEMVASPEGFGNAVITQAMSFGRDVYFEDPLCPVWLENARKIVEYKSQWFGMKRIKIESGSSETPIVKQGNLRALCFSGGVDSFHSLLTYPQPIDKLIMVHGYDIHPDDTIGAQFAYEHIKQVAASKSIDAILIKTNFRKHHISGRKYRYSYGGALAAIGFFVPSINELIISSGLSYSEAFPDGSHWQTDPLRSSASMKIIHNGADYTREEKLRIIASAPLVRKHLHVCQQNLRDSFRISEHFLNCGHCEKCNRTLLVLQQECDINDMEIFENTKDLDVDVYHVAEVHEYLYVAYKEIIRRGVNGRTALAIRALLRRSRILHKFKWAGRRGVKAAFAVLRLYDTLERKLFLYRERREQADTATNQ